MVYNALFTNTIWSFENNTTNKIQFVLHVFSAYLTNADRVVMVV